MMKDKNRHKTKQKKQEKSIKQNNNLLSSILSIVLNLLQWAILCLLGFLFCFHFLEYTYIIQKGLLKQNKKIMKDWELHQRWTSIIHTHSYTKNNFEPGISCLFFISSCIWKSLDMNEQRTNQNDDNNINKFLMKYKNHDGNGK